jgi:hypothetical protein
MKLEDRWFIYSILAGICITMLFTLIPIWQLVIIPAIIAGFLNKSMKQAVLGGILSVSLSWIIYIVVGLVSRNVYSMLDQFGALMFGEDFGWLILLIIIILSVIFGALGGGIGNSLLSLKDLYFARHSPKNSEINATKK